MASSGQFEPSHYSTYPRISPSQWRAEFAGKSVLITGGGYGLGAGMARSFAEAGVARIVLAGRTESSLQSTAAELRKDFPATLKEVKYFIVDVGSQADIDAMFAGLGADSPDVLVNNAGYLPAPAAFPDVDVADWWKGFEVNVLGTMLVTRAYLMHRRGADAKKSLPPAVVLTLNTFGALELKAPKIGSYVASKAAAARLVEAMAVDVPPEEARFVSIHPGAVKTAMYWKSGLDGGLPVTDQQLTSDFTAWAATDEAAFLNGRFAWVNFDVDYLVEKKDEIVQKDLLITVLKA